MGLTRSSWRGSTQHMWKMIMISTALRKICCHFRGQAGTGWQLHGDGRVREFVQSARGRIWELLQPFPFPLEVLKIEPCGLKQVSWAWSSDFQFVLCSEPLISMSPGATSHMHGYSGIRSLDVLFNYIIVQTLKWKTKTITAFFSAHSKQNLLVSYG